MDSNTFVVADPHKCIGCKACEIACAVAHLEMTVVTAGASNMPFQPRLSLVQTSQRSMPIQCRQCEDAPCANACPVGAIMRQKGRILVDTDRCFGCKTCMLACPFGAMDMVQEISHGQPVLQKNLLEIGKQTEGTPKGRLVAHKCDLCGDRADGPACVEACPAKAFVVVRPRDLKKGIRAKRDAAVSSQARHQSRLPQLSEEQGQQEAG